MEALSAHDYERDISLESRCDFGLKADIPEPGSIQIPIHDRAKARPAAERLDPDLWGLEDCGGHQTALALATPNFREPDGDSARRFRRRRF